MVCSFSLSMSPGTLYQSIGNGCKHYYCMSCKHLQEWCNTGYCPIELRRTSILGPNIIWFLLKAEPCENNTLYTIIELLHKNKIYSFLAEEAEFFKFNKKISF